MDNRHNVCADAPSASVFDGDGAERLGRLLDRLADPAPPPAEWGGWRLAAVPGGANNRLVRAIGHGHDLAIKWTIRDQRRRAGREWGALRALREAGLDLAPAPLHLDDDRYPQPVVVQSWLAGQALAAPPADDADWAALAGHYAAIHAVTAERVGAPLPRATITAASLDDGLALIEAQIRVVPAAARPPELPGLVRRLASATDLGTAAAPGFCLCRVDANWRNFLRLPADSGGRWASVDWENSGWGDPAFELAELMTHPAYLGVPAARWPWLIDAYCAAGGAAGADAAALHQRVAGHRRVMLVWWVARLARSLYEVPRGLDRRLADRPAGWQADQAAKLARYAATAAAALP